MVKGFFLDKSQRSLDHLFTQSLYTSTGNQLSTQCYSCLVFIIKMCTVPPLLVSHCAPYTVHLYFLQHQNRFSFNRINGQIFFLVSKLLYRTAQPASQCQASKQLLLGTLASPWKGYPPYARPGRETLFGEEWRVHSA